VSRQGGAGLEIARAVHRLMISETSYPRVGTLFGAFGWVFCLSWAGALLAFPAAKGLPAGYLPVIVGLALGLWALRSPLVARAFDWVERQPDREFLLWLLVGAAVARAAAIAWFPLEPRMDDEQFHRYAMAMAAGDGYGAPGARAWFPPGMSLILTAWYSLTAPSPLSGKLLHLIVGCALVWQTWAALRGVVSERVARVSALLVAALPTFVFYTATLGYETVLALILVLCYRLAVNVTASAHWSWWALAGLGALLGVGSLVKPIGLLAPLILGVGWRISRAPLRLVVARVLAVTVVMLAVIAPWTWRNYQVLGAFVPISTNGGYTLYAANNPKATGLAVAADPVSGETGEVTRDRLRMRAALTWIAHNPDRWLSLALVKVTYTWGTTSTIMSVVSTDRLPASAEAVCKAVLNVSWAALLVWCAAATFRKGSTVWLRLTPATLFIAYVFGLHLFYEANSRHHVTVLPFIVAVAADALGRHRGQLRT
jgi:Dolichyl-phosphate-mannose-protein mannosyltransferase